MSKHITLLLTEEQRSHLLQMAESHSAPQRVRTRARILLLADRSQEPSGTDRELAEQLGCSRTTIVATRRTCVQRGLRAALFDAPRHRSRGKITGDLAARLTMLYASAPPPGRARWTLRLLAQQAVARGYVASLSHAAVGGWLKKNTLPSGSGTEPDGRDNPNAETKRCDYSSRSV